MHIEQHTLSALETRFFFNSFAYILDCINIYNNSWFFFFYECTYNSEKRKENVACSFLRESITKECIISSETFLCNSLNILFFRPLKKIFCFIFGYTLQPHVWIIIQIIFFSGSVVAMIERHCNVIDNYYASTIFA